MEWALKRVEEHRRKHRDMPETLQATYGRLTEVKVLPPMLLRTLQQPLQVGLVLRHRPSELLAGRSCHVRRSITWAQKAPSRPRGRASTHLIPEHPSRIRSALGPLQPQRHFYFSGHPPRRLALDSA